MRWLPRAVPILIVIIVVDFMLVSGLNGFRILSSPIAGLEQPAFARVVYGLGRLADLGPPALIRLATLFGVVNLAITALLALHLLSRVPALRGEGGGVDHDLLDTALILVVGSTILAATPAILQGATEILIQQRLPLWLVGLAATLSMIERLPELDERQPPKGFVDRALIRRRRPERPVFVSPARRDQAMTARWSDLRSEAGMRLRAAPKSEGAPWFAMR